jgi:hypothetical protein
MVMASFDSLRERVRAYRPVIENIIATNDVEAACQMFMDMAYLACDMSTYIKTFSKFADLTPIERMEAMEAIQLPEDVKVLKKEVKELVYQFHAFHRVACGPCRAASPASH